MSSPANQPGHAPPLVSIIVPTYNQGEFLAACLDSLWFQDWPNLEIVIVNDGSTDDTEQVIEDYQREVERDERSFASHYDPDKDEIGRVFHPRYPKEGRALRVLRHERNRGLAAALNTGFQACAGTYCTYVPSDDACFPSMFSEMVAVLEAGADFVYADMFIVDGDGRIVRRFALPEYSFERCFADWYLCGVAKLYRRELHEKFGWYDEGLLAHDHELFQRFAMKGAVFRHIPKVLMSLRDHDRSREVDLHAPESWKKLLEESKRLVGEARAFLASSPHS